jgi:hypothetical protein
VGIEAGTGTAAVVRGGSGDMEAAGAEAGTGTRTGRGSSGKTDAAATVTKRRQRMGGIKESGKGVMVVPGAEVAEGRGVGVAVVACAGIGAGTAKPLTSRLGSLVFGTETDSSPALLNQHIVR